MTTDDSTTTAGYPAGHPAGRPAGHPAGGLRHVELGARDLDRSADFYGGLLGFEEAPVRQPVGDRRVRWFRSGTVLLKIVEAGRDGDLGGWVNDDLQTGIRHVGMKVGDVDARVRALEAAGVTVLSPPADVLGDVRIAFFLDPDGARLEFVQGNLHYQTVASRRIADAERATRMAPGNGPRFDHVAVTVPDLPAARRFWCDLMGCEAIGQIRHDGDPRGFLMTYLQAGSAVLEVFSFDVPTAPNPGAREPSLLGFRGVGLSVADSGPAVGAGRIGAPGGTAAVLDPGGVPVEILRRTDTRTGAGPAGAAR